MPAFLYAGLIVLPLIDAYRHYFARRMALTTALSVGGGFGLAGLTPAPAARLGAVMAGSALDYGFCLNIALGVAGWLFWQARSAPARDRCGHSHDHEHRVHRQA